MSRILDKLEELERELKEVHDIEMEIINKEYTKELNEKKELQEA